MLDKITNIWVHFSAMYFNNFKVIENRLKKP